MAGFDPSSMASKKQQSGADDKHCEVKQTSKITLMETDIPYSISATP